jgi:hypothetical protein
MRKTELTLVFGHKSLSSGNALTKIAEKLSEVSLAKRQFFRIYGKRAKLAEIAARFRHKQNQPFSIEGSVGAFNKVSVTNNSLDFLSIRQESVIVPWRDWASLFCQGSDFVMAWLADCEYEYWQNASDPLQFQAAGRAHENLPLISNGLPPPLEKAIVDISNNPGRRILRTGYIEAVGNVMWLGEPFWALTGAKKEEILMASWLKVSNPTGSVFRIQASDKCFTQSVGESAILQLKMRCLLFPAATCAERCLSDFPRKPVVRQRNVATKGVR